MCKAYKFAKLNKTSKKKAIEKYRQSMFEDGEIDEQLHIRFKEVLNILGFPIDDINYRLSHSQDDGIAFYGEIDLNKLIAYEDFYTLFVTDFKEYLTAIQKGNIRISIGREFGNSKSLNMALFSQIHKDFEKSKLWKAKKRDLFLSSLEEYIQGIVSGLKKQAYVFMHEATNDENVTRLLNSFNYLYHADGNFCQEGLDNAEDN